MNRPPYTIKRACSYLSLSDSTVRRLIKRRVLRARRITQTVLIPAVDVENLVPRICGIETDPKASRPPKRARRGSGLR